MNPYTSHSKVSLVIADVDGTLVTHDKILTPCAKAAVTNLRAAGIAFAITSGRPPLGMKMIVDGLNIDTIIAGFNGGLFVKPDFTVVLSRFVSRAASIHALELIREHKLVAWLYTDTDWYVPDPHAPHVARETWTVKFEAKVAANFSPLLDRVVKIVAVSDDLEAVARCETAMQAALRDQASTSRSQPYYLDVTHLEATKGGVVEFLSRSMNIPEEAIVTLGDMPNDVSMTFPVLNNAAEVILCVAGFEKTSMVREVWECTAHAPQYPVQMVQPNNGIKRWMLDKAAVSQLTK